MLHKLFKRLLRQPLQRVWIAVKLTNPASAL